MRVPYYEGKDLKSILVQMKCPGCGRIDNLVMHDRVVSHCYGRSAYWVGCNCGWTGPEADNPALAAIKWDVRAVIVKKRRVKV